MANNFNLASENDEIKTFINNNYELIILVNTASEEVSICHEGELCTKINFIPKGGTFVDLLFNQTIVGIQKKNGF